MTDERGKLTNKNGEFTEEGNRAVSKFRTALESLMDSTEVKSMSQAELRVLGSLLAKEAGDAISLRIEEKIRSTSRFEKMTDEEFEDYLLEKYGSNWQLTPMSPEELDKIPVISYEKIHELLKKATENIPQFYQNGVIFPRK